MEARAYWTLAPGRGEIRRETLRPPGPGEALVRALWSGISRGTESLVHRGRVPAAVAAQMRAPFQEGELGGPVKYGYLSVGVVEHGPEHLLGRTVFVLHPHQDRYVVPVTALTVLPDDVPPARGVLAGTLETAVNAVWDAAPRYGDRVAVVGLGMVGAAVAVLLADFPLSRLEAVEVDPARADLARRLGVRAVTPEEAAEDCDVVVHCSATERGLRTALTLAGDEAEVVELSWYGDLAPAVPLGEAFHARRLTLRASQVGAISPARRGRRDHAARMDLALAALADPRFDVLLAPPRPFADLPEVMAQVADGGVLAPCQLIAYPTVPQE